MIPQRFAAQGEVPTSINDGALTKIATIFPSNPDAAAAAYVKLYVGASAPNGSSEPVFSARVGALSCPPLPVFAESSHWWIAVATEPGAGLTAPATYFEVSITFE